MIIPTIRASLDRREALHLVDLLARHDPGLRDAARSFTGVRTALNRLSDRYLWPRGGDLVNRILREVTQRVDRWTSRNPPGATRSRIRSGGVLLHARPSDPSPPRAVIILPFAHTAGW